MQAVTRTEINMSLTPQVRELIKTIVDAATALKQIIPIEEFEHGFEFHWGHSNFPNYFTLWKNGGMRTPMWG
jgi:hypothetical protein